MMPPEATTDLFSSKEHFLERKRIPAQTFERSGLA
jgi:hypothetical protein